MPLNSSTPSYKTDLLLLYQKYIFICFFNNNYGGIRSPPIHQTHHYTLHLHELYYYYDFFSLMNLWEKYGWVIFSFSMSGSLELFHLYITLAHKFIFIPFFPPFLVNIYIYIVFVYWYIFNQPIMGVCKLSEFGNIYIWLNYLFIIIIYMKGRWMCTR